MQKFKVKTEFRKLILPELTLHRRHLTDALVEQLRQQHPDTFKTYFEEVKKRPSGNDKP